MRAKTRKYGEMRNYNLGEKFPIFKNKNFVQKYLAKETIKGELLVEMRKLCNHSLKI